MIKIYSLITLLVGTIFCQNGCFQKSYSRISEQKCDEYKNTISRITRSWGQKCGTKSFECGAVGTAGLIVGGLPAKVGEFPHMAAIGWSFPNGSIAFRCGGSLISERFVLTAAHCDFDPEYDTEPEFVRLGTRNLAEPGPDSAPVELRIKKFVKHPNYNSLSNSHDIALIELERDVKFNDTHLRPACLQQKEYNGKNVTATGWGTLGTRDKTSDHLMKVVLPVNRIRVCKNQLSNRNLYSTRQVCAGGQNGKDTCRGDSGGPIQVAHFDAPCVYNITGVTSFGAMTCGTNVPAVYTKVKYYLDWIESIVWPGQ